MMIICYWLWVGQMARAGWAYEPLSIINWFAVGYSEKNRFNKTRVSRVRPRSNRAVFRGLLNRAEQLSVT